MGMSASQVRFLSLQSRKNSIGRQLLTLSNRKMALSRDMNTVAMKYNNALNQTVLKWSNDSGSTYNALTYNLMMQPNDLNTEKPYIVTDASTGKVILNNDDLGLTDQDGNAINLSYVDIAKMISAYSGNDADGKCQYNNISNLSTTTSGTITGGNTAMDGAYYIPNANHDYTFDNTLRYEIFEKMGLITESDKKRQINLLNQLYGSEEAEKTSVFPVGSAWGDYYIAQASLEAYDDFTSIDHSFADSNTFSGSRTTSENKKYTTTYYDYSANLQGTDSVRPSANTQITQQASSNSATSTLSHIDFNSFTTVVDGIASTSYKYTTAEDGTVSRNSSFSADYSGYDDTNTYDAYTYNISVSSDGIRYTYSADDLWQNAKTNYVNAGNTLTDGAKQAGTSSSLVKVGNSNGSTLNSDSNQIKTSLGNLIDSFIEVLNYTNVTTLDTSKFQEAKEKTIKYFIENADNSYDGATARKGGSKSDRKARARASGKNHVGISRYGGFASHSNAYVDTTTLLNTFLTYYSQLSTEGSVGELECAFRPGMTYDQNTETQLADSFRAVTETDYLGTETTKWYYQENYKDSTGTYMTTNSLLTTVEPDDITTYTDDIYVFDTSTDTMRLYNGSEDDEACYEKYYFDNTVLLEKDEDTLMYNVNGCGWDDDDDPSTPDITIYGTVEHGNDTYYFTTIDELNAYKNNGTLPANKYSQTVAGAGASVIHIAPMSSQSQYGISVNGEAIGTDYRTYLENQIDKAYQHIKDLEESLDNLYSSADTKIMDYYDALFQRIAEYGWTVDDNTGSSNTNATTYLNNKLQNNDYFITECSEKEDETGYNYASKMATSVKKIYSVYDENAANNALMEYEAEKTAISTKEQKIDLVMEKLETEQESISTMMESVQKIISENIDKTFKMFA